MPVHEVVTRRLVCYPHDSRVAPVSSHVPDDSWEQWRLWVIEIEISSVSNSEARGISVAAGYFPALGSSQKADFKAFALSALKEINPIDVRHAGQNDGKPPLINCHSKILVRFVTERASHDSVDSIRVAKRIAVQLLAASGHHLAGVLSKCHESISSAWVCEERKTLGLKEFFAGIE